mgnify:FL=1
MNDMTDVKLDSKVSRTKARPLVTGEVTSVGAVALLGAHLTTGLGLLLTLNPTAIAYGVAAVPLVLAYPWFKRFTNWPQVCSPSPPPPKVDF